MASAMAYFQANRGKLSGQISANVVSSSRTSEGINYKWVHSLSSYGCKFHCNIAPNL